MAQETDRHRTWTILVVDDDTVTTDLAKMFLERHGFTVVVANDGEAALEALDEVHPDLVLLDVIIPKLDGFEVCRRIRARDDLRNVPVLMFTARGLTRDIEAGREAGADEYIVKPFSGRALVATIRRHLGLPPE